MRSTIPILICCLYALSAVNATPFSKRQNAEVQQGNTEAAEAPKLWSDNKDNDDDKDDKWSKDDDDVHYGGKGQDDCASRSVSVLIGTSTYAIPCLQGRSIVNLNGLIPTPEASSSAVSISAIDSSTSASSSEASSTTDSTTTTDIIPPPPPPLPYTVTLYNSSDCTGDTLTTSLNSGCFDYDIAQTIFSVGTTSTPQLEVGFYAAASCAGDPYTITLIDSVVCGQHIDVSAGQLLSYSVISLF